MAKNKKQNSDNNNSGANASYVDADVHSGEYRDKLYKIIDGLTKVTRRWDEMMDYDIVICVGTQANILNRLADKIDKQLKESQQST